MAETPRRLTFGANVAAYELARPEWPVEAVRWLVPGAPLLVVELGAGTGKLTRALARLGLGVLAVEPDPRMLDVLKELQLPDVEAVEGEAEEIALADGAADAVVVGSAFHWFDLERVLAEIHRVLGPGGTLGFAWNHRDASDPAMGRVAAAIHEARGKQLGWSRRPWSELLRADGRFEAIEHGRFPHVLELPREALSDHLRSYTSIAALPAAVRETLEETLGRIVDEEPSLSRGDTLTLPFVVDGYRAVRTAAPVGSRSP